MGKRKLLNGSYTNAGLASLAGAGGAGFTQAGKQIASLGSSFTKQDADKANKLAAEKEKKAQNDANVAYNKTINPELSAAFKSSYGGDVDDERALGLVRLESPKEKKGKKVKSVKPAADGGNDIVNYEDGSSKRSLYKSKSDWNKSKDKSSKNNIPAGFILSRAELSSDFISKLKNANAYFKDDDGNIYTHRDRYKTKYDKAYKLGKEKL